MFSYLLLDLAHTNEEDEEEEDKQKSLDVFISYRRSNGSQLARYRFVNNYN